MRVAASPQPPLLAPAVAKARSPRGRLVRPISDSLVSPSLVSRAPPPRSPRQPADGPPLRNQTLPTPRAHATAAADVLHRALDGRLPPEACAQLLMARAAAADGPAWLAALGDSLREFGVFVERGFGLVAARRELVRGTAAATARERQQLLEACEREVAELKKRRDEAAAEVVLLQQQFEAAGACFAPPPGAAAAAERRRLMAQYRRLKYSNAFAADEGAALGARALGELGGGGGGGGAWQTPRRSLLASRARSRGSREGARGGGGGGVADESSKAETRRAQLLSARVAAIEESEEHAATQQEAADACDRACRRDAAEERNADAAVVAAKHRAAGARAREAAAAKVGAEVATQRKALDAELSSVREGLRRAERALAARGEAPVMGEAPPTCWNGRPISVGVTVAS